MSSAAEEVGRERVELFPTSDEREAEGQDGELDCLILPCDYG